MSLDVAYGSPSGPSVKGNVKFNPASGSILDNSGDVSSVTVHGTGQATVNLIESYADGNFTVTTGVQGSGSNRYWTSIHSQTANTIRVYISFGNPFTFAVTNANTHLAWTKN